jgi:hypothetical protein
MREFLEETGLTTRQLAVASIMAVVMIPILYGLVWFAWCLKDILN